MMATIILTIEREEIDLEVGDNPIQIMLMLVILTIMILLLKNLVLMMSHKNIINRVIIAVKIKED